MALFGPSQVHAQGCLEEERLEEGGGVGDHQKEEGGKVGGHHLTHDLSLHRNLHLYSCFWMAGILKNSACDGKEGHVLWLSDVQMFRKKGHSLLVQTGNVHIN